MSIINKLIVLKLNKNWQPVGYSTVGKAIVDLAGGQSAMALDLCYELNEEGEPVGNPTVARPIEWDEWVSLPIRSYDLVVHYGNGGSKQLRVPTVLIAKNFAKMPVKNFKGNPSKEGVWNRDGRRCQYTGRVLDKDEATVDHVLPKSKGGRDIWENVVLTSKELNSRKGNHLNSEIGLTLLRPPMKPKPMPLYKLIREAKHRDWKPFLLHIDE
jgi:hypothetical protein